MTYLFEGPTRYVLMLAHVPTLIYLRDVAAFALVAFAVSSWLGGERRLFPLVVAVYVLFLHLLCGVLTLPSLVQPLLGLKVFFTFFVWHGGVGALWPSVAQVLPKLALAAFVATVCGVALDVVIDFRGQARRMSPPSRRCRCRASGAPAGFRGLRGFARASFDAATIILGADRAAARQPMERACSARCCGWTAFVTIWLTTSKGASRAGGGRRLGGAGKPCRA